MDVIFPSIFPAILLPLYTLIASILLPTLALKGRTESMPDRLFTLLCFQAATVNLLLVGLICFPTCTYILALTYYIYPLSTFIIPLGIEILHRQLSITNRSWVVSLFFILAVTGTVLLWTDPLPIHAWGTIALCIAAMGYLCLLLAGNRSQHPGAPPYLFFGGVILFTAIIAATFIPSNGTYADIPISLEFIPLFLIALGLASAIRDSKDGRLSSTGVLSSGLLAFILLPLAAMLLLLLISLPAINAAAFWSWLFPMGMFSIFAFFICALMAEFSLMRSMNHPGALLFGIICLLWGMLVLQDVLLVVLPEHVAVSAAVINDAYLATFAGFLVHLLCVLGGKPRSKIIPVAYGASFILMPAILFQTQRSYVIYHYYSGPFIKTSGFAYTIFAAEMLAVLCAGAVAFAVLRHRATDPSIRQRHTSVLAAMIMGLIIALGTIPLMSGHAFYPIHQLIFIPLFFLAHRVFFKNIANTHTRYTIMTQQLRAALIFIYGMVTVLGLLMLKDIDWAQTLSRIIPYGIPPLLSFFITAFLSLYVLGLERDRLKTFVFSALCLVYFALNLDNTLMNIVQDPALALGITRFDHFFLVLFPLGGLLHLAFISAGIKKHQWVIWSAYGLGLILAPFTFTDLYFQGIERYSWGFVAKDGPLFELTTLLWTVGLLTAIVITVRARRQTENRVDIISRRCMVLGFLSLFVLLLGVYPAMNGMYQYQLGNYVFVPMVLLAFGLFRQNLYPALQNIRTMISFSIQIAIFLTIVFLPQNIFEEGHRTLASIVCIVLAFFLFVPIQKAINLVMDLFIRSTRHDLKNEYYSLTQGLLHTYRLNQIQNTLADWFFQSLKASSCAILVRDREQESFEGVLKWNPQFSANEASNSEPPNPDLAIAIGQGHRMIEFCGQGYTLIHQETIDEWLQLSEVTLEEWITQAEIIIPIVLQDKLTAIIALGGKISDTDYTRAEREILHNLGPVVGANIENARLMEGLEQEVERRTQDLNSILIDSLIKEKEISESNTIITRQNEIFRSLLETSTQIHQIWKLDELFSFTLNHLHDLYSELGFGIILEGGRSNVVESLAFVGISDRERDIILSDRDMLLDDDIDDILYGDMLVKGVLKDTSAEDATPHWTVFPMMISPQQTIGKMIIKGELEQTAREVITVFLGQLSAVTQGKLLMRELEKMASMDGLTGVFNRTYFNQEHTQAMANADRYRIPYSIIMVDVNALKQVNDYFGHERGDEMIIRVAQLLREACRKSDIVARIGGDEFAALMPSTTLAQAEMVVRRLRMLEGQLQLECRHKDGREEIVPIRFSVGVASSDQMSPDQVLGQADKRMYQDKDKYYTDHERYR